MTISRLQMKSKVFVSLAVAALAAVFSVSVSAAPNSTAATEGVLFSQWRPITPRWSASDPWRGGSMGGSAVTPSATPSSTASGDDATGLVLINTEVDFGAAQAAGTGMVIDEDGVVVTNHHVVAGSTSVTVTDPATAQTYTAEVLGYDATTDVAVLTLDGADSLATITTDTDPVDVGQTITAVGNAGGVGRLISSTGRVTATGQNITVTEDDGGQAALTNLIAVSASLVPGDSGGALLDTDSEVVGMNVAGSSDVRASMGYAIPISSVLHVAGAVLAGAETDTVALGRTAALGVQVSTQAEGVYVVGVVPGGPADQGGITPGSTLTSLDGAPLSALADLTQILAAHKPSDRVEVSWTDATGAARTATLELTQAPLT